MDKVEAAACRARCASEVRTRGTSGSTPAVTRSPGASSPSSERCAATSARRPRCWPPWWPRSTAAPSHRPGRERWRSSVREWLDHAAPSFSPKTVETTRMYIEDPIIPAPRIHAGRQARPPSDLDRFYRQLLEVGRSRGPYAPATIRRVHGIIRQGIDPRGPLGLDHPQSGHRCLASPGADEGAEAPGSRSGGAAFPSGPGVGPRAGDLHHAGGIVGGPEGRAPGAALERHRSGPGKAVDRAGHRAGRRRPHRTGHEDASESPDLARCRDGLRVEGPRGADDRASSGRLRHHVRRASCSVMRSTARRHGIRTRPLEPSGRSASRRGHGRSTP